jgi:hypothetical protein
MTAKKSFVPPKPRCEASCYRLHGPEVVTAASQTIPLGTGQHPVIRMPSTRMGLCCWWWLFNSPVLVGLIWTTRYLQEKSGESYQTEPCNTGSSVGSHICRRCQMATETASHNRCECVPLAEFRCCSLGKHFYETKLLWWDSVTKDAVPCQSYGRLLLAE